MTKRRSIAKTGAGNRPLFIGVEKTNSLKVGSYKFIDVAWSSASRTSLHGNNVMQAFLGGNDGK